VEPDISLGTRALHVSPALAQVASLCAAVSKSCRSPAMNLETLSACPLRGGENIRTVDTASNICECEPCGYLCDNPRPMGEELIAFYSQPTKYDSCNERTALVSTAAVAVRTRLPLYSLASCLQCIFFLRCFPIPSPDAANLIWGKVRFQCRKRSGTDALWS